MKHIFLKLFLLAVGFFISASANATAIIDPATGMTGSVGWSTPVGTGFGLTYPVTTFMGSTGSTASITVSGNSTIDFSIADIGVAGDAFALTLDGLLLDPTSGNLGPDTRGPSATSYYSAFYDSILLSAGTHSFQLFVTDACCTGGGTSATFSAVTPASTIPEPASIALMGLGLAGLGFSRRKVKSN